MSRHLHLDQAAEREAGEIAFRFMNSSDVVGDMSRAYGADLSAVRIHTDESAARAAEGAGADAFSTGKDVYFGRGAFDRTDPASRGLLAHELAHSLQQGVGGGMEGAVTRSAPEGAAQGGFLDWFRKKFGKKPVSLDNPNAKGFDGYRIQQAGANDQALRFMSKQSRAIYQMAQNATPEQLRSDTALRKLILDDYRTSMAERLQGFENDSFEGMFSAIFRGKSAGELASFNRLMRASMPENMVEDLNAKFDETGERDAVLDTAMEKITGDRELLQVLRAGMEGFGDSVHFSGENQDRRSAMLMNNLMLRAIAPGFTQMGMDLQNAEADRQGVTREMDEQRHAELVNEAFNRGVGMEQVKRGALLQDAVRFGPSASEGGKRFLAFLNRWSRR